MLLVLLLKTTCLNKATNISSVFSSGNFIVLDFPSTSIIHFELFFVYGHYPRNEDG